MLPLKERRREEIEKKLEEKAEEERKEVSSQKKELYQTRREKQHELRMVERKMDNAELVSDYFLPLRGYSILAANLFLQPLL